MNKFMTIWFLAAVAATGCGPVEDGTEDLEGESAEALDSIESAVIQNYYSVRYGLGQTIEHAPGKGVNMKLENRYVGSNACGEVTFWPNVQLPAGDTRVAFSTSINCKRSNGTVYNPGIGTNGSFVWKQGKGSTKFVPINCCPSSETIYASSMNWSVDN